jgi:uncharacterized ferritin-like protein (DUF455 family)
MNIEGDAPLIDVFNAACDAPSAAAFLLGVGCVLIPALVEAYRTYLSLSDPIADGPTHRFLSLALEEREAQGSAVRDWAQALLRHDPEGGSVAERWMDALNERLAAVGGVPVEGTVAPAPADPLPGARSYAIPDVPARDDRFHLCRFYWPDIVDPSFPYGEGAGLQLRSAISHLNEAWAVETAGAILWAFAGTLPWDWVRDAARWTYDESRHCRMGYERLRAWGFEPTEIPLGTYIYESAAGQEPIYRLGMLYFFETKNIGKKPARARQFHEFGDAVSEHDMDFDWADETIHAHYGKRWLDALLRGAGQNVTPDSVRQRCAGLVDACVRTATDEEREDIRRVAERLLAEAETRLPADHGA